MTDTSEIQFSILRNGKMTSYFFPHAHTIVLDQTDPWSPSDPYDFIHPIGLIDPLPTRVPDHINIKFNLRRNKDGIFYYQTVER